MNTKYQINGKGEINTTKKQKKIKKVFRKSYCIQRDKTEYILLEYQKRVPGYKYTPN